MTDGILEADNANGEFFGDARLEASASDLDGGGADELASPIAALAPSTQHPAPVHQLPSWPARPESFADD